MTGKQLKAWAAKVSDEATILVREAGYSCYKPRFDMQAVLDIEQVEIDKMDEQRHAEAH